MARKGFFSHILFLLSSCFGWCRRAASQRRRWCNSFLGWYFLYLNLLKLRLVSNGGFGSLLDKPCSRRCEGRGLNETSEEALSKVSQSKILYTLSSNISLAFLVEHFVTVICSVTSKSRCMFFFEAHFCAAWNCMRITCLPPSLITCLIL